jgi:DNA-binding NarL/FixJ family response regulator
VRIVIGEDQTLMREGLRLVLDQAGFTVVATAADATTFVETVRAQRPDLVVADIRMPPGHADDGLRAVLELRAERPDLPAVVLSQHVRRQYAAELLEGGGRAVGYLLKQRVADVDAFAADVCRVRDGATVLDPVVVAALMDRPRRDGSALGALTERQREVLALMAEGHSNAVIGARLFITEKAVVRHASHIYEALGIPPDPSGHRRVLAVVRYLSA